MQCARILPPPLHQSTRAAARLHLLSWGETAGKRSLLPRFHHHIVALMVSFSTPVSPIIPPSAVIASVLPVGGRKNRHITPPSLEMIQIISRRKEFFECGINFLLRWVYYLRLTFVLQLWGAAPAHLGLQSFFFCVFTFKFNHTPHFWVDIFFTICLKGLQPLSENKHCNQSLIFDSFWAQRLQNLHVSLQKWMLTSIFICKEKYLENVRSFVNVHSTVEQWKNSFFHIRIRNLRRNKTQNISWTRALRCVRFCQRLLLLWQN